MEVARQLLEHGLRRLAPVGGRGDPIRNLVEIRLLAEKVEVRHQVTQMLDDRLDVLEHLRDLVPNLYLFGEQPDLDEIPDWVTPTTDWREASETVLEQLARDHL